MRAGEISILIKRHYLLKSVCKETPTKNTLPSKSLAKSTHSNLVEHFRHIF